MLSSQRYIPQRVEYMTAAQRDGGRDGSPGAKGLGVLFAVGAVSGTILSFEMGMLWPGLMERFGQIYGFPFTLEAFAFFIEAIFLGVYLYGWNRLPPRIHMLTGLPIIASGVAGAFFVVAANGWMNTPTGEAGGAGGPLPVRYGKAAVAGWDLPRRPARRRDRDPLRAVVAHPP